MKGKEKLTIINNHLLQDIRLTFIKELKSPKPNNLFLGISLRANNLIYLFNGSKYSCGDQIQISMPKLNIFLYRRIKYNYIPILQLHPNISSSKNDKLPRNKPNMRIQDPFYRQLEKFTRTSKKGQVRHTDSKPLMY